MKKINTFAALLMMAAAAMFSTSCENDNINPYDYVNNGSDGNENQGSKDVITTKVAEYPAGSVVWTKDTTLSQSVEIPVGASLYIEPGVTVRSRPECREAIQERHLHLHQGKQSARCQAREILEDREQEQSGV